MKTLLITGLTVAAIAGIVPALANPSASSATGPRHKAMHAKPVTRAEMTQRIQQHFARLDTNRDGFVTKAEADAAADIRRDRMVEHREKRGAALFERFDVNKDGVVTRAEAEPFFADGSVDIAHSGPGDRKPRRNWDALVARFDTNKDGNISRAEFDAGHAQHAQKIAHRRSAMGMHRAGLGGRLFEAADTDQDGRVSLAEATAAATARFDAADTNRDGTLTRDEIRAAHRSMRNKPAS